MKRFLIITWGFVCAAPALAQDVNYQHLNQEGFGGVSDLLQSMTPQQRAAILQQADVTQKDVQKLTPDQRARLLKQLQDTAATIDFDKIDPDKLDPSKMKSVADTQKDLDTYQKKYQQGKIKNSVVIPPPAGNSGQ